MLWCLSGFGVVAAAVVVVVFFDVVFLAVVAAAVVVVVFFVVVCLAAVVAAASVVTSPSRSSCDAVTVNDAEALSDIAEHASEIFIGSEMSFSALTDSILKEHALTSSADAITEQSSALNFLFIVISISP